MGWPRPIRPLDATNISSETTEGGRKYLPDRSKEWTDGIQDDCHDPLWSRPRDYIRNSLLKTRKYTEVLKRAWSGFEMTPEGARVALHEAYPRLRMCASRSSGNSSAAKCSRGQSPGDVARPLLPNQPDESYYERRDTDTGDTGVGSRWW